MYVNVGVRDESTKNHYPHKKALKDAIKANAAGVYIYSTSPYSDFSYATADLLTIGVKYQVTGPDPYTSRKWYATVEKKTDGTIKVS